jgi:hypothetical protein
MAISGRADYRAMGGDLGVAIGALLGRGGENVDVGWLQSGWPYSLSDARRLGLPGRCCIECAN